MAQSTVPSLEPPSCGHQGMCQVLGEEGTISAHTAFPSSSLRSFWADSKWNKAALGVGPNLWKGKESTPLAVSFRGEDISPSFPRPPLPSPCWGCYHPPLYVGCPRHCGDGHKSWQKNTDSRKRQEGELVRGRRPFQLQPQGLVLLLASSCHQLITSESEMSS